MAKILIIEDDIDILKVYSEKLKLEKHKVLSVNNAEEGLDMVVKNKPDLILLDIMLPGKMNGFDLLEELKRHGSTSHIPVIVLTNVDTERETALEIGANEYLVKADTKPSELLAIINKYLGS